MFTLEDAENRVPDVDDQITSAGDRGHTVVVPRTGAHPGTSTTVYRSGEAAHGRRAEGNILGKNVTVRVTLQDGSIAIPTAS
jgi:hypothetical protein